MICIALYYTATSFSWEQLTRVLFKIYHQSEHITQHQCTLVKTKEYQIATNTGKKTCNREQREWGSAIYMRWGQCQGPLSLLQI